jgi:hypothetical protein
VLGTLVFTCLLPLSVILVMIHRGNLTDIYIRNPKQRTMPYIYSTICYGFWAYFCSQVMHLPQFIVLTAIGSTVVLLLILLINRTWKISAHLASLGGLFGAMMSFSLSTGVSAIPALAGCSIAMVCFYQLVWFVFLLINVRQKSFFLSVFRNRQSLTSELTLLLLSFILKVRTAQSGHRCRTPGY